MNGKKLTLGERKLKKRGLRLIQGRRTPQPVLRPGGDPLEAFALFMAVTILFHVRLHRDPARDRLMRMLWHRISTVVEDFLQRCDAAKDAAD
jgi:hypothetical protein